MNNTVLGLLAWAGFFTFIVAWFGIELVKEEHPIASEIRLSKILIPVGPAVWFLTLGLYFSGLMHTVPLWSWILMAVAPIASWFFAKDHEVFGTMLLMLHLWTFIVGFVMTTIVTNTWKQFLVILFVILVVLWLTPERETFADRTRRFVNHYYR